MPTFFVDLGAPQCEPQRPSSSPSAFSWSVAVVQVAVTSAPWLAAVVVGALACYALVYAAVGAGPGA